MLLIPAIDLKGGRCVRLIQGQKGREIVYGTDPVAWASRWAAEGARRLHLIDLDGAFGGAPAHVEVLARVTDAVGIPVEFGGGVRSDESLGAVFAAGASFVILGTSALKNPEFLESVAHRHPGKILLGIDAKDGEVRIAGWEERDSVSPTFLANRFSDLPLAGIIFTDIRRDGTLKGFDPGPTEAFAEACDLPVIAAGGVSRLEDVEKLIPLADKGIVGAVVGRALYEGTLDFTKAMEMLSC